MCIAHFPMLLYNSAKFQLNLLNGKVQAMVEEQADLEGEQTGLSGIFICLTSGA